MKVLRNTRIRESDRERAAETRLSACDLIQPYFVVAGKTIKEEINSMPGIYRFSIDELIKDIRFLRKVKSLLLFGVSRYKDDSASQAYSKDGIVHKAVRAIKDSFTDFTVITDVCLCGYTTHGHCGIVKNKYAHEEDFIDLKKTLNILARIALSHAEAGADVVAPSAMMDGQVGVIRKALEKEGFLTTRILAYAAKYASHFYGPFRDATQSAPQFGDRKSYQMDYRNSDEAMKEIKEDIEEGADMVMIKPALAYLDIIRRAKENFTVPIAAYNVSGEYAMLKNYTKGDKTKEHALTREVLTAIKRSGADKIITYFAKEAEEWL